MTDSAKVRVCTVYPADPVGVIPGGIDSFIRGILRWAPADIRFSVIGVTTDARSRPQGRWTVCDIGDRTFDFFPAIRFDRSERQSRLPLTVRFVLALARYRSEANGDVLEFHRIEPCLPFLRDHRPKTLVMHQNMRVIRSAGSDIRWKYLPGVYFAVEDFTLKHLQSVFCVREDAVRDYQQKFPQIANRFHFTPTWFDSEVFQPPAPDRRQAMREGIRREFDLPVGSRLFIWVGRLDKQKNPLLMIDAFGRVHQKQPDIRLLLVGDGVLRGAVERRIRERKLEGAVVLGGVKPAVTIAGYLQGADAFLLPSVYEGMPICVLEALGSGLPVVATDVGEVRRVVHPGINGELVTVHDADHVAAAMIKCLDNLDLYSGRPAIDAAAPFTPHKVLAPIYENYRRLAASDKG